MRAAAGWYSRSTVFFTWAGFDEGDEITGSGSAELNDDGTIEIAFTYHHSDEAVLKAERMTSSTACSHARVGYRMTAGCLGAASL